MRIAVPESAVLGAILEPWTHGGDGARSRAAQCWMAAADWVSMDARVGAVCEPDASPVVPAPDATSPLGGRRRDPAEWQRVLEDRGPPAG